ncbi:MAG TPA: hypothetical protein VD793_12105 [Gemmatimonadales bacterium]|nr:hypothetical protein [Gemmatimonadales bacterium]
MTVPSAPDPRLDRGALERIIQRAAELQAAEREIGDGLTDAELLALGREVGIPERHLHQALLEERSRSAVQAEPGLLAWMAGPARVGAGRVIQKTRSQAETALSRWMAEGELLQVKRRFAGQLAWEPQQGAFASLKRAFRTGGRRYILARAREVSGSLTEVEGGRAYVQLVADIGNLRRERLSAAAFGGVAGLASSGIAVALGVILPVAVIPAAAGLALALPVARKHRDEGTEAQSALEQVLDRLEHGDLEPHRGGPAGRGDPLLRVAEEIRGLIGERQKGR